MRGACQSARLEMSADQFSNLVGDAKAGKLDGIVPP